MADIISYNNLIPVSDLRLGTSSSVNTTSIHEKQPDVTNYSTLIKLIHNRDSHNFGIKEKLSLSEWAGGSIYVDLIRWADKYLLLQGLIINKYFELEYSKKIAVNFMGIPNINSSDKFYL